MEVTPLLFGIPFLHVFIVEFLQNLPSMVGTVQALKEPTVFKKGLYSMLGMIASSIVISYTDGYKLLATTLEKQYEPSFLWALIYGVALGLFTWLYLLVSKVGNWLTQVLIGAGLGFLFPVGIALIFKPGNFDLPDFWPHTWAFTVTGGTLLLMFRLARDSKNIWHRLLWVLGSTTVMTLIIGYINYYRFLL